MFYFFLLPLLFPPTFGTSQSAANSNEEIEGSCNDILPKQACDLALAQGMCRKMWVRMRVQCPHTCGFCGPQCRDVFGWFCSRWRFHSVCVTHRPRMKEWCRETCGFCRVPSQPSNTCSESEFGCCWDGKTPAMSPDGLGCGECYDRLVFCPQFHDDCYFYRNKEFMAKNCPLTCGLCKPRTFNDVAK